MFSTSFKIVIGYILLVGLLIGAFTYTMQQMNLLTTPTSLRDQLDHRRHITHRIISQLYDAESIGQTLRTGNLNEYYHYLKAMKEVNASIDTLETILTDTLQQARLDTVRTLLASPSGHRKNLVTEQAMEYVCGAGSHAEYTDRPDLSGTARQPDSPAGFFAQYAAHTQKSHYAP